MSWLVLATVGQFLGAVVVFLDKYIVTEERALPRPFVYAFYSCLLTGFWVLVYFIGYIPGLVNIGIPSFSDVERPSIQVVGMSFLAAYTLFMALVSFYDALRHGEAINVMPVVGGLAALFAFVFNYLLLDIALAWLVVLGIFMLTIGTFLVAAELPGRNSFIILVHSGLFFGLHAITMKGLFEETNFADGFFWSRVGLVAFTLSLLLVPTYLDKIKSQTATTTARTGVLVILAKVLAGISAFLILKATDLGDAAVVQALDGLKFVFILIISVLFASLLPTSAVEIDTRPRAILRQVSYVAIIAVGLGLLVYHGSL
jgi:uncharacterized membrane protein